MDALKAPISGDGAFGYYLKGDRAAYRALRNAFNGGQTAFRALSETTDSLYDRDLQAANQAAWARLADEAGQILRDKSKDIEVFVWFIAAQMHQPKPIQNTAAVLGILTDLVESNWDDLQPIPPDEKADSDDEAANSKKIDAAKLRIFLQLVGEVPQGGLLHLPLTNIALFQQVSHGQLLIAEKDGTLDAMRSILSDSIASDSDSVIVMITQLQEFLSHAVRLNVALRPIAARCNETPIPVSYLTKQLEDTLRLLKLLSAGTGLVWPDISADGATAPQNETEAPAPDQAPNAAPEHPAKPAARVGFAVNDGRPPNREAALANIAELARYFRATEPQSPVHLMLDRALRWGQMSIVELYAELFGENSEGFNRLSLVSGLESFEHSGSSGLPAASQRVVLPEMASYANALADQGTAPAPKANRPDRAPAAREGAPEPEMTPEPPQSDEAPTNPTDQEKSDSAADLPVRSFEW